MGTSKAAQQQVLSVCHIAQNSTRRRRRTWKKSNHDNDVSVFLWSFFDRWNSFDLFLCGSKRITQVCTTNEIIIILSHRVQQSPAHKWSYFSSRAQLSHHRHHHWYTVVLNSMRRIKLDAMANWLHWIALVNKIRDLLHQYIGDTFGAELIWLPIAYIIPGWVREATDLQIWCNYGNIVNPV